MYLPPSACRGADVNGFRAEDQQRFRGFVECGARGDDIVRQQDPFAVDGVELIGIRFVYAEQVALPADGILIVLRRRILTFI